MWAVWIARLDNWSDHHVWYRLPASKLFVEILTNYPKLFFSPKLDTVLVGRMLYSNRNTVQLFALLIWLFIVFVLRKNFSFYWDILGYTFYPQLYIYCNWSWTARVLQRARPTVTHNIHCRLYHVAELSPPALTSKVCHGQDSNIWFSACKTFSSAALLKNSFIRYDLACTNYAFMK